MASHISINNNVSNPAELITLSNNDFNQNNRLNVDKITAIEEKQLLSLKNKDEEQATNSFADKEKPETLALEDAINTVKDFMQLSKQSINFVRDDTSDITVIKVFDTKSKELIKQFPSEEVLEIAKRIIELRQDVGVKTGILLDEKV